MPALWQEGAPLAFLPAAGFTRRSGGAAGCALMITLPAAQPMPHVLRRINDTITRSLMVVAAIWALFLGFYILADVIARNLNMPIPGTQEIVRDSIVVVVFLQLAYCVKIGGMLRADFLVSIMTPVVARALTVIGYVGGIALFLAILYGSWGPALDAWRTGEFQGDGALRVPTWPSRFAIILGCALVVFNYVILIIDEIAGRAPEPDGDDSRAAL